MRCATSVINPAIAEPAKGRAISSTRKIAMIFGTKTSVISWICVSACNSPITTPTTSAVSMAGVTDLSRRLDRAQRSRLADLNLPRYDSDPAAVEANSPLLHADRIRIPVLLAHGRRDFTVPVEDTERMEDALKAAGKRVQAIYFDDDDHYLFREEDRIAYLKALAQFLAENLSSPEDGGRPSRADLGTAAGATN